LPQVDWSQEWKRGLRVQTLGELSVAPPWLAADLDPARTIVIDPGMAFGTGEHATTRGVIRLLQRVIEPGDRVADLGAGSAILAIAAAKLGASHVAAIEIDPDAIGNAEENVERNDVADRVVVIEGDAATLLPLVAPVQLITANIISSVLIELLPLMTSAIAQRGHIILSGILFDERDMMTRVIGEAGWRIDAEDREESWWSAAIARQ
jgi:ribosomal protein L11 methyltransferase